MIVSGALDDLKANYQRLQIVLGDSTQPPARWPEGVESLRQDGRTLSILASHNADAIAAEVQSIPGVTVERFPVTLKEIFLEHVRN
jgi:hypothetical protein